MDNRMDRCPFDRLLAMTLLVLAGCAGQPAPKTASSGQPPPPPIVHLLCHAGTRSVGFAAVGVPEGERPVAAALTPRYAWVLFQPARLLRVDRAGGATVQMLVGGDRETWDALDADPLDGSVWIGEEHPFSLHHVTPDLRLTTVEVQRVQGDGTFNRLLVGRDALYVSAAGADDQVWRIERTGHFLAKAFPSRHEETEGEPSRFGRGFSHLAHSPDGGVVFWDGAQGKAFAPDASGAWVPSAVNWFDADPSPGRAVKGVGVGSKDEMWYLYEGGFRTLFFWKGQPIFLSSHASGIKNSATVLVVPASGGGEPRELFDRCDKAYFLDVVSDTTGYLALTHEGAVIGDFASSPDLP